MVPNPKCQEADVIEIFNLLAETGNEKEIQLRRKALQDMMKYEGDHFHNLAVLKEKRGQLILAHRSSEKKKIWHAEYGPCPSCLAWVSLESNISKHQKVCATANVSKSCFKEGQMSKSSLIFNSQIVKGTIYAGSKMLQTKVFPTMRRDSITEIAQKDPGINLLRDEWMSKGHDNEVR